MTRKVISGWEKSFDPALSVRAGQPLQLVERSEDEFPGWVWSLDDTGLGGWLPHDAVEGDIPGPGRAGEDFDTVELSVSPGDLVETGARRCGWTWCADRSGAAGWVPDRCLEDLPGT